MQNAISLITQQTIISWNKSHCRNVTERFLALTWQTKFNKNRLFHHFTGFIYTYFDASGKTHDWCTIIYIMFVLLYNVIIYKFKKFKYKSSAKRHLRGFSFSCSKFINYIKRFSSILICCVLKFYSIYIKAN